MRLYHLLVVCLVLHYVYTLVCMQEEDCSLNGVCQDGVCKCDDPWTGDACDLLSMLPIDKTKHPGAAVYGYSPNVSSWGGSIIQSQNDSYHLFVTQMKTGGMAGWKNQSECVHAVSNNPSGPFIKSDIVVGNECHGPVMIRDQNGEWLMFHIGNGSLQHNTSRFMHHSSNPAGPWTPAKTDPGKCHMPTAAFHPNGTLYMVCGNGARLVFAEKWDSVWKDIVAPSFHRPSHWEDPTLWFDRRQNWHIIFHVYATEPFEKHDEKYSGHAFSKNGIDWIFSKVEPFNGTIHFTDGSLKTFATRERPQLVFLNKNRTTPIGMTSAVSSQPLGPWCDQCREGACSQCKVTPGRDWTYTIFQPLKGFQN